MPDVNIKYKGSSIATMDSSGAKTLHTSGKYCEGDITVEYSDPQKPEQSKTVTPTAAGLTVSPDSGKVLSSVIINGDSDLTANNIRNGVNIFGVTGTLNEGITPSGTKNITENGTYDVTNFASASVVVENDFLKAWKVTVSSDITTSGVHTVLTDPWIAAHYNDNDLAAGYITLMDLEFPCVTSSVKTNALHAGNYGYTVQRKDTGGISTSFEVEKLSHSNGGSRASIVTTSAGNIKISASGTYPLRAGTYLIWAIRFNGI